MSESDDKHWGQWVEARADMLGIKRRLDLAERVGCSRQQLGRWLKMARPPRHMHKGLDGGLCRALELDRHTLFFDWHNHNPHDLPREDISPVGPVQYVKRSEGAQMIEDTIFVWLRMATDDTLMKIVRMIRKMIEEQNAPPDDDTKTLNS